MHSFIRHSSSVIRHSSFALAALAALCAAAPLHAQVQIPWGDITDRPAQVDAVANLATNGMLARIAAGQFAARTITGTAGQITVANGDGAGGNPAISLQSTLAGINTITSEAGQPLAFGTGIGGTALTISSTGGNIGIGVVSPESMLHMQKAQVGGVTTLFVDNNASGTVGNGAAIKLAADAGATLTNGGAEIKAVMTDSATGEVDIVFTAWSGSANAERLRMIGGTGKIALAATVPSTSTTTGALTVAGGVGAAGAVNAGGGFGLPTGSAITNISAGGGITFNATTTAMRAPGQPSDQFVLAGGTVSVGSSSSFVSGANKLNHANGVTWSSGPGSPEGVVTAPVGSIYSRTDGAAGTSLYIKESGIAATGWIAK